MIAAFANSPAAAQTALTAAPGSTAAPELAADPALRTGTLPNGMRYQIFKNATPPNLSSIRLRFGAGSIHEREDELGLAHFVEHMMFNGTRNVPEGEFTKRLERAGLKFGPDTNGFTTWNQTVYILELPKSDAATVDTALHLLREVAGEADFKPAAVERERGVVLSEERLRATPMFRNYVHEADFLLKGDLLPKRMPIGSAEVLKKVPPQSFQRFYDAYYRPERTTLIAVGDFDVDAMEAKIRSSFGSWKAKGPAGAEPPESHVVARGGEADVFVEPGIPARVSLSWVTAPDLRPDTSAVRIEKLREMLGLQILSRRLERIAATSSAPPFIGAGVMSIDQAERAWLTQLTAVFQPGKWQDALGAIDQERRRALQFGFTQAELDREVAQIRAHLTAAAAGASTRPSPDVAGALLAAVDLDNVFTTPAADLTLFNHVVTGLQVEVVNAAIARLLKGEPLVYIASPVPVEGGKEALLAAYHKAQQGSVLANEARQSQAWPYHSFGKAGEVVERREFPALGVTGVRFGNGVRLTVKPTDFKKDEILVSAVFGNGQLDLPTDRPNPLWSATSGAFILGGLGKISYEDMQEALSSKVYSVMFGSADELFYLTGPTRPDDLPTQLQVMAAYMADPGFRPSGHDRFRAFGPTMHDQLATSPGGVFQRDAGALLHSGDPRWAFPSVQQMEAGRIEEVKALLADALQHEPLEVVMVGNVTVDEAIKRVSETFGALPARRNGSFAPAALQVKFPKPEIVRATHRGRPDQGLGFIAWPTEDFHSDQRRTRTLDLLAEVVQLRLMDEIREKQGASYYAASGHHASETFPGYGHLSLRFETVPADLDRTLAAAERIVAELRERPVSEDELQRARKPLLENIQKQRATNGWWIARIGQIQTRPEISRKIETELAQYQSLTAADLQEMARRYLREDKAWKMVIAPEKAP